MSYISALVTDIAGNFLAELPQAIVDGPFRALSATWEFGGNGAGSLDYRFDNNPLLDRLPHIFDPTLESATGPNLVWMTLRGKSCVWLVEMDSLGYGTGEAPSEWITVGGSGVRKLMYGRLVLPANLAAGNYDQSTWATSGYPGSGPDGQWMEYAGTGHWHVGEVIWDLISQSNALYDLQIVAGTIETDAVGDTDLWVGLFRFESLGEVIDQFEAAGMGRAEITGSLGANGFQLVFNWYLPAGAPVAPVLTVAGLKPDGSGFTATRSPDVFDGVDLTVTFDEGVDLAALRYRRTSAAAATHMMVESSNNLMAVDGLYPAFARTSLTGPAPSSLRIEKYARSPFTGAAFYLQAAGAALTAQTKRTLEIEVYETVHAAITDYDVGHYIRVRSPRCRVDLAAQIKSLMVTQADDRLTVGIGLGQAAQSQLGTIAQIGQTALDATATAVRQPLHL